MIKTAQELWFGSRLVARGFPLFLSALPLCACGNPDMMGDQGDDVDATAQARQAILGSNTTTWQRPEVGWWGSYTQDSNGNLVKGLNCTATLIHQQFVLSAAHCGPYPEPRPPTDQITFYNTSGTPFAPYTIDAIWSLPAHPDFPKHGTNANLNSDILVAHLKAPVPESSIVPAIIANNWGGPDNTTVSVFGFGNFGATTCPTANNYDFQKRAVNFSFGQNWPICPGDSGGPTFNAAIPGGQLISVNGSSQGAGSVVRYREEIYEHMRRMSGVVNGVSGLKRNGITLSTGNTGTAPWCELACQWNTSCRGWTFTTTGTMCTLLSAVGGWVPDASSTSGLANRESPGAISDITQTPVAQTTALSATDCAAQCARGPTFCAQYNYASGGNCLMYGSVSAVTGQPGYTTGTPLRGQETGIDRPGGDIKSVVIHPGDLTCAQQCEQTEECRAYTLVASSSTCWLKWAVSSPTANASTISGVKRPPAIPNRFIDGVPITKAGAFQLDPSNPYYVPVPARAEQCRADCAKEPTCIAYNVQNAGFGTPVQCRMLMSVSSEDPGTFSTDVDSNYKGLTYF